LARAVLEMRLDQILYLAPLLQPEAEEADILVHRQQPAVRVAAAKAVGKTLAAVPVILALPEPQVTLQVSLHHKEIVEEQEALLT
jgi:hypothetical protein